MKNQKTQEIYTNKTTISCSGIEQNSPHPKIYLSLLPKKHVICPYCNIKYSYIDNKKETK